MRPKLYFKTILSIFVISFMLFNLGIPIAIAEDSNVSREDVLGVLVIAHGAPAAQDSWNVPVRTVVQELQSQLPYPVELGFLEFVSGEDIHDAVRNLENEGVTRIIAVPLFVSSASGHMEEIKYVLGLPSNYTGHEETPGHGGHSGGEPEEELTPVQTQAIIELTPGLDDHRLIAEILSDRLETFSTNPTQETLILAAHGPGEEQYQETWANHLNSLGAQLQQKHGFQMVKHGYVAFGQPDVRTVAEQVYTENSEAQILVMPVMISEGYFTDIKIPNSLQGLNYSYPEQGQRALMPHDNIPGYISARVTDALIGSVKLKEGEQICTTYLMDVALEEGGKICICAGLAFRAMQEAISVLNPDTIPEKDRFMVVGPKSHGTEEVFALLLGEGHYSLEDREHNDLYYRYQVVDRQTGRVVSIQVRPEVFPEGFFELKQKIKDGTATAEEKQAFKSLRAQVVEKVCWQDCGKLFTVIGPVILNSGGGGSSSSTDNLAKRGDTKKTPEIKVLFGSPVSVKATSGAILMMENASITIPANASPEDIKVSISKVAEITGLIIPASHQLISDVLEITKNKTADFTAPVSIQLRFDKSGLNTDEYEVKICFYDETKKEWIPLDNISVDLTKGTVCGEISHLTKFAVLAFPRDTVPFITTALSNRFSDILGHWAEAKLKETLVNGVISGYPDGTFRPDGVISRAEFCTMAVKTMHYELQPGNIFTDSSNHWARDYISTAVTRGMVHGYSSTSFGPDDPITREQMAVSIYNALKNTPATNKNSFSDNDLISPWARDAVDVVSQRGLISGYPDRSFQPQAYLTRAEAATVFYKLMERKS
jgi:sirohydrochlorin ferrochelatase